MAPQDDVPFIVIYPAKVHSKGMRACRPAFSTRRKEVKRKNRAYRMVLIIDGNSEHVLILMVTQNMLRTQWRKIGLFGEKKNAICDCF